MRKLHDPTDLTELEDGPVKELLAQRFEDIAQGEEFDPGTMGFFVLVELGDSLAAIEAESGCWISSNPLSDKRYPDAGFVPVFEVLEEHTDCFEMVFVMTDGDYGVVIVVPKSPGIDSDLLKFCQDFAMPAPERTAT